ncbi:unnamed protein product [Heterobilharzia americana]|nr:unnamed protein product [Heterobilharzia americana]
MPRFNLTNNSLNDYLDYLLNGSGMKLMNSGSLQYSLRLVLHSQLLLINRAGIDLRLKLPSMKNNPSSSELKRDILLGNNECIMLAKNQHYFQLGVVYNDEVFWSETLSIQLPPTDCTNGTIKSDWNLSSFTWNSKMKTIALPNMPIAYINILVENRILCLIVHLQCNNYQINEANKLTERSGDYSDKNFIISIKPRYYVKHLIYDDFKTLRIKPIVIPIQQKNVTKMNNSSIIHTCESKLNEVTEISCQSDNTSVLWWTLPHSINKSLPSVELMYCMQISVSSTVHAIWSEVFPLHRVPTFPYNTANLSKNSSVPIYLYQVTAPVSLESSTNNFNVHSNLLITTMEQISTSQIIIQINKSPIFKNLNPFSVHFFNCAKSSVYSIELSDQLSSSLTSKSSEKHWSNTKLLSDLMESNLKSSLVNWYPHKIYPNSQLSLIPQSLLELLYIDTVNRNVNSRENLCFKFFHPSHFSRLDLNLYAQTEDTDSSSSNKPISINLKELCSSISEFNISGRSEGFWRTQKHINDQLSIHAYYSLSETSFGLIIQLINRFDDERAISIPSLSVSCGSLLNSVDPLNKVHLTVGKFCIHLLTFENRIMNGPYYQKKKLSSPSIPSSSFSSPSLALKHNVYEMLPPQDEFVRLTTVDLCIILVMKNPSLISNENIQLSDKQFIVKEQFNVVISLQHLQLDNWCHSWTNTYDFPVIVQTVRLRRPKSILQFSSTWSSLILLQEGFLSLLSSSPVITLFLFPPNLDVYLEDSLIYDFLRSFSSILPIFNGLFSSHQLQTPSIDDVTIPQPKIIDETNILVKQLVVDSFRINLSLHAMLRLYLSCHSAPLNFTSFKLINFEEEINSSQYCSTVPSGSLVYWCSIKHLLTIHYFTQMLFRSGWLVGSLDLLGNVTGLLYSLMNGFNDLIHLRSSEEKIDEDEHSISMITSFNTNSFIFAPDIRTSPGANYLVKDNRNIGFLYRLTQGLSSLTRRTTGGLLLSISGMASSLARNLDYLSLDPRYEQHQDHIRRHRTPKGFGEGIQLGLSSFGLCLLSAIAGVADQPLQAIFKTIDNQTASESPEGIFNLSETTPSNQSFLLSTLGGFGRGLVGVVTKPAAGAAELIAQTSKGLLHGTSNAMEITIPSKYGDPYISPEAGLLLQYQNVDSMIIHHWGSVALQHMQSNQSTADRYSQESLICCWFATAIYDHNMHSCPNKQSNNENEILIWLAASIDPHLIYTFLTGNEVDSSYFSWSEKFSDDVLKYFVATLMSVQSKHVKMSDSSRNLKNFDINEFTPSPIEIGKDNSFGNLNFISPNDSWKWIDHMQFNLNDLQCLMSIIQNFWLADEKMKELIYKRYSDSTSTPLQNVACADSSFDSRSDLNSPDLFVSDRHSSKWRQVREYLMGISPSDLLHI